MGQQSVGTRLVTTISELYQSSSLVVVQVHQHVFQLDRVTRIVLLVLTSVDETRRELVAVVCVVAASSPLPVTTAASTMAL